jgi:SAM-dependent methyltransferase
MTPQRLAPPFWRHDAYTLNKLARHIADVAEVLRGGPSDAALSQGDAVVDLGAGAAPYRTLFERPGIRYVACDLDVGAEVLITAGKRVPLRDHSAKVVVSFQVLEHVWDLDWYLSEVRRLLTPAGALVLSTHGTWLYHPHPTDYRRWTRDGLVTELTTRGFAVEQITGLVGPLAWTTQFRALGFHRLLSTIPIFGPALAAVVGSFMNARMWVEDRITPTEWTETNAAVYVVVARKVSGSVE